MKEPTKRDVAFYKKTLKEAEENQMLVQIRYGKLPGWVSELGHPFREGVVYSKDVKKRTKINCMDELLIHKNTFSEDLFHDIWDALGNDVRPIEIRPIAELEEECDS